MDELWFMHTTEYYSAIKRTELLKQGPTWINLKSVITE